MLIIDYIFYYFYMIMILAGLNFIARKISTSKIHNEKTFRISKVDIYVFGAVTLVIYLFTHAGTKYFIVDDLGWIAGA